ncbi:MAG TPA: response regulator [Dehalococcoidia bacterium]|nr:response regulator [Dehalococcoidia bacterium]
MRPRETAEAKPGALTVLVVEDDERIQRLVELVLRGEGYCVLQASDGRRALELLDREKPDLVILDLMLPLLDGWTLREKMRQQPATAEIPVILMSAVRNLRETARQLQVADYLSKPFEIDDLVRSVRLRLGDIN